MSTPNEKAPSPNTIRSLGRLLYDANNGDPQALAEVQKYMKNSSGVVVTMSSPAKQDNTSPLAAAQAASSPYNTGRRNSFRRSGSKHSLSKFQSSFKKRSGTIARLPPTGGSWSSMATRDADEHEIQRHLGKLKTARKTSLTKPHIRDLSSATERLGNRFDASISGNNRPRTVQPEEEPQMEREALAEVQSSGRRQPKANRPYTPEEQQMSREFMTELQAKSLPPPSRYRRGPVDRPTIAADQENQPTLRAAIERGTAIRERFPSFMDEMNSVEPPSTANRKAPPPGSNSNSNLLKSAFPNMSEEEARAQAEQLAADMAAMQSLASQRRADVHSCAEPTPARFHPRTVLHPCARASCHLSCHQRQSK